MSSRRFPPHKLVGGLVQCTVTMVVAALPGIFAVAAHAALGGSPLVLPAGATVSSTAVAQAAVSASGTTSSGTRYGVRQITLAGGTVVREYISAAGEVFGVAWNGPRMPPLDLLLGSEHFSRYIAAASNAGRVRGRGPVAVNDDGLVVHSGGHMGALSGEAWLQQALPAGVSSADIR